MKMLLALTLLLTPSLSHAAEAQPPQPAQFSEARVVCNEVWWMNLDGSVECHRPFFKALVTNGVNTLTVDGPLNASLRGDALRAQGQGICAMIGYMHFVSLKAESLDNEPNREAYGPSVTLNAVGEVARFEKSNRSMVSSITCK